MMHLGLKPITFVLNSGGYTIERFMHGPTRSFNDIVNWYEHELSSLKWCFPQENCRKWTKLLDVLSDETVGSESCKVTTKTELNRLLLKPDFGKEITLIEVVAPMFDAPPVLRRYRQ